MKYRQIALEILIKTLNDESYSNLLMRKKLETVPVINRPAITNLVNGVLRKYEYLNYQFSQEINNKTSLRLRIILSMALYERFFLKEKDYAINNEYVELGKNDYEKSFINAILHKINEEKTAEQAYINSCLPKWIYNLLASQYDKQTLDKIIRTYQSIPTVYYRLNKNKASYADLKMLNIRIINDDIFVSDKNLLNSEQYLKGLFYVQDINSASLYKHLQLNKDHTLLDVCSAPGSKLFNCLDIVKTENAYANDIHPQRVNLIKKMADRLGFKNLNYLNYDGNMIKDNLEMQFDRILLDVPCSGLGVIGRKPDLKFHIKPDDLDNLEKIQYELLINSVSLLKDNGVVLYSTCTLNKKENTRLIHKFLKNNINYLLEEEDTIINELSDCFYYAKLRKVNL